MTLPEPARSVWKTHRRAIYRIATAAGRESRVLMGGGTVLAARWGHRRSTDIDILLPARTSLNDAAPGGSVDLAAATGGRPAETLRRQIRVDVSGGRIDVAAITPELEGLERSERIDGEAAIVLASEQVLRGKLKRSDEFLTRDAFDIAVAAKAERRALEIAVNSMSEQERRIAQYNLEVANDDMAREAPTALESVAPIYQDVARRPGEAAADAMQACRYTEVAVRLRRGNIEIETRTAGGPARIETYDGDDPSGALHKSGIQGYLDANSRTLPATVEQTLESLRQDGREGLAFAGAD